MNDIKIEKIVIDLPGDRKLSLSLDEAKELKRLLDELLGGSQVAVPYVIPWYTPPFIWKWTDVRDTTGTITICSNSTNQALKP